MKRENYTKKELFIVNATDGQILYDKYQEINVMPFLFTKNSKKEIDERNHLSFSTIAKIWKAIEGETNEKNRKPIFTPSQAFKLFEKNKTLVQITIELDLPPEDISNIYKYLILQYRHKFDSVLKENKNNKDFLKTFYFFKVQ